jgi:hypothetical protein
VGVNVAWTQLLENQVLERALLTKRAEVYHHRYVCDCAGFHCALLTVAGPHNAIRLHVTGSTTPAIAATISLRKSALLF